MNIDHFKEDHPFFIYPKKIGIFLENFHLGKDQKTYYTTLLCNSSISLGDWSTCLADFFLSLLFQLHQEQFEQRADSDQISITNSPAMSKG